MTTSATGSVVDEHDAGLKDLAVVLRDISQQFDVKFKDNVTDGDGAFFLTYADHLYVPDELGKQLRRLRLRNPPGATA